MTQDELADIRRNRPKGRHEGIAYFREYERRYPLRPDMTPTEREEVEAIHAAAWPLTSIDKFSGEPP